jgi:hypothetical protein
MSMTDDKFFSVPVTLSSGGARKITIRSAGEAAWFLAERWPRFDGSAFMKALRACAAVLDGRRPATHARRALLLAAREAELAIDGR